VRGVLVLLILGLSAPSFAARYTLQQLLDKVAHEYAGVKYAEAVLSSSQAQVSQAKRGWAPTGDLTIAFGPTPNIVCGESMADKSCGPRWDNWNIALYMSLNLYQPLFSFGKVEAATANAKANLDVNKGYLGAAKGDVMVNAMRAYWGLKWARASRDTLDEGIEKLAAWVTKIEDDLNASRGNYNEGDLARLKIALDEAKMIRGDIMRGLSVAERGLKVLTEDNEADVDGDELEMMDTVARPVTYWVDSARVHRPEAKVQDAILGASKGWHRLKTAEMLPDLGLQANATYWYAPEINAPIPKNGSLTLMLMLRTPLDFGVRYGRLQQARSDEKAAADRRRAAFDNIAIEVERAYADAEEARSRSKLLGHASKISRGWYNSIDQNMSAGLVTDGREFVDAARAYFGYRIRYLQSILDANLTLVALRRATGVD